MPTLLTFIASAGALGTASFGIVEAFKGGNLGLAGFSAIKNSLTALKAAFKVAYGDGYLEFFKDQYREKRTTGPLRKTIRQGARIGLNPDNAAEIASAVGNAVPPEDLVAVAQALVAGDELTPDQMRDLGRFELALDARIDACFSRAEIRYRTAMQKAASLVSIGLALVVAVALIGFGEVQTGAGVADGDTQAFASVPAVILTALIIGVIAVPIAPIAKDVTKAITAVTKALKGGK